MSSDCCSPKSGSNSSCCPPATEKHEVQQKHDDHRQNVREAYAQVASPDISQYKSQPVI